MDFNSGRIWLNPSPSISSTSLLTSTLWSAKESEHFRVIPLFLGARNPLQKNRCFELKINGISIRKHILVLSSKCYSLIDTF